jgi:sugar O-acyltransferase (sialic acid O-acetyltransferase NeuD family)
MPHRRIAIIGAGGHGKVVFSVLQAQGVSVYGFYDDTEERWGLSLLGVPVRGPLERLGEDGIEAAVVAIGDNRVRQTVAERLELEWLTAVHPAAWVHPSVLVEPGSVIFAGAIIQPDCRIGRHVIVNTSATIDHDCAVGDFAHLAPGSHMAGSVRVGKGAFVGIGASAIPGRRIGAWSIVGAGALVAHDVPPEATAVGVPARPRPGPSGGKR